MTKQNTAKIWYYKTCDWEIYRFFVVSALFGVILFLGMQTPVWAKGTPESFAGLVQQTRPAVVSVTTTQKVQTRDQSFQLPFGAPKGSQMEKLFREFYERYHQETEPEDRPRRRTLGTGSGFFLTEDGYVVTNNHVIEGADEIFVITTDDTRLAADLVGRDEKTDLALLKVQESGSYPALAWGDSEDQLRIGDWVMAIGNPRGLGGSVSAGIISQKARNISRGPYDSYIQTDAAINPGNSGGPLVSMDGRVVGVNTLIFTNSGGSQGLGFSIPAHRARLVIDQLKQYGEVRRGWLGVMIQPVNESIAESLGLDKPMGALVQSVTPDSPAAGAAIQAGDVILTFDQIDIAQMQDLPWVVAKTTVGRQVPVDIWRNGQRQTVTVTVARLDDVTEQATLRSGGLTPETEPTSQSLTLDSLGLTVAPLTAEVRRDEDIPDDLEGIIITDIAETSAPQDGWVRSGDVIVEANQMAVASLDALEDAIRKARDSGRSAVLMKVWREGQYQYIGVRLEN